MPGGMHQKGDGFGHPLFLLLKNYPPGQMGITFNILRTGPNSVTGLKD
jgi:hypothetical protein